MFLYSINQIQNTDYHNYDLLIIYIISIIIAISVIVVKSPVVSILNLIALFCLIAIYLVKSGMTFAGLIYLLVYVGAISILFIFIIMLLNVRISELLTEGKNSAILALLSILSINFLFSDLVPNSEVPYDITYSLFNIVNYIDNTYQSTSNFIDNNQFDMATVTAGSWDISLSEISHISSVGNMIYTICIVNLILVSLIILLAMIGAIAITVKNVNVSQDYESNKSISTSINFNS